MNSRLAIAIRGAVQGVGMRPEVYRIATSLGLSGNVCNTGDHLMIEAEGPPSALENFLIALRNAPPPIKVHSLHCESIAPQGELTFSIKSSQCQSTAATQIPRDVAPCRRCIQEVVTPTNRRYLYPFITCSECGPRFSILRTLPFDRASTSMAEFMPCDDCSGEYADPKDPRFHAQTISCPACGPLLQLYSEGQAGPIDGHAAIVECARLLLMGKTVALKGIGGYQLLADASNEATLNRLREGKVRPGKPLPLMFGSIQDVYDLCYVKKEEHSLLTSSAAPIVLLQRRSQPSKIISPQVAPFSPHLGAMLPSSPLHHLLLRLIKRPLVATSGNRHGEPIYTTEVQATARLAGLADAWLVHNRAIEHRIDDAIVRIWQGKTQVLRLGRGFAPLAIPHHLSQGPMILAAGSHEKNTFAVTTPSHIVLSQHNGDLSTIAALSMYRQEAQSFAHLLKLSIDATIIDLHPDDQFGHIAQSAQPILAVQHHHAHALSCLAEHGATGPCLAFAWDGTGYGSDHSIWGGEVLHIEGIQSRRVGHLRTFPLPGGDKAAQEPRRAALGLLYEIYGADAFAVCPQLSAAFTALEKSVLLAALNSNINAPRSSSVGRLFDAVASLLGICQKTLYAEQAAVALEDLARGASSTRNYMISILPPNALGAVVLDWEDMIRNVVKDVDSGACKRSIARGFHVALAQTIITLATKCDLAAVALTGGVFQNTLLLDLVSQVLTSKHCKVYIHGSVPSGDGGLAAGQALYGMLASQVKGAKPCV